MTLLPLERLLLLLPAVGLRYWDRLSHQLPTLSLPLEIRAAIQPRRLLAHLRLVLGNLILHLHRQTDVVQPIYEAVLPELLDLELAEGVTVSVLD